VTIQPYVAVAIDEAPLRGKDAGFGSSAARTACDRLPGNATADSEAPPGVAAHVSSSDAIRAYDGDSKTRSLASDSNLPGWAT
jgi:hypothetical protein